MDNAALGGYVPGSLGAEASADGRGGARDRRRVVLLLVADSAWLAGPSGEVSGSAWLSCDLPTSLCRHVGCTAYCFLSFPVRDASQVTRVN